MCLEHQCPCCPNKVLAKSCDCRECFHDNKKEIDSHLDPEDEAENKNGPKLYYKPVKEAGEGCQSKQPAKCNDGSNDETEVCSELSPAVGRHSNEMNCNQETELPLTKRDEFFASEAKAPSCCSDDACKPVQKITVSEEGTGCCSTNPGSSAQNACDIETGLPAKMKSDCSAPEAKNSTCCSEDACGTNKNTSQTKGSVASQFGDEVCSAAEERQPGNKSLPNVHWQSGVVVTTKLRVLNICCALEGTLVEDALTPLDGVSSLSVNVIGRVVYVHHLPEKISAADLVDVLNKLHLGASIMESGYHGDKAQETGLPRSLKLFGVYLLLQAVLLLIAMIAFIVKLPWYEWVVTAEIIFGIVPILQKSFVSVKTCTLDINILMLIAIAGTVAIGEWIEGAIVVFVYSVAHGLEEFCMHKVQQTISGLMLRAPDLAVLADTGELVNVKEVAIGTVIAVRPGDLIPLDGIVVKGRAAVDESSISGEAVPVEKSVDSKVCSGTVNQNGYLEIETTVDSSSSTVSKVAGMVEEAQATSTQTEVVINRFAKYYTPVVVMVAAHVIAIPAILGASGVGTYLEDLPEWGKRALSLLVIACPCALVMASPIAAVCGITSAARNGALVKGAVHLETLARLQILACDKTGTLTEGKFQVTDIECVPGVDEGETLRLAAAIESKTSHPLAAGIVNKFSGCVAEMVKSQSENLPPVSKFQLHEGRGISGVVNGKRVQIGNREFLHHVGGILLADMEEKYTSWSQESKTVVFVCVNGTLAMMMSLADSIRPNSLTALKSLREIGVQTAMITGDNSQTAMAVKNKLGLDQCVSQMKPHEKLSWIKNNQGMEPETPNEIREHPSRWPAGLRCRPCSRGRAKGIVGMVGDGVNDGPALAASNVGIAMGAGGTALAVEAADVALMSNNLSKIPELVLLGRFCQSVVRQNIAFSVLLKLLIVAVALAGKAALWMAVLADVLGLLCVILNGLRPLWWKAKAKKIRKKKRGCFGRKGSSSFTRIIVV